MIRRPRVVVCGTRFGRIYLAAFDQPGFGFELAGILARGSDRSCRCAARYGVPLFTGLDELPDGIDIACVVIGGAVNGGPGAQIAQKLLQRGIHVLHEHPVHHTELETCLRTASQQGVVYHLNTLYPQTEPVRRFLAAGHRLLRQQPALFLDAVASCQVLYPLLDVLTALLGRIRPWAFADPPDRSALRPALATPDVPLTSVDGVLGGVPLTLRLQNQLDADEPNNYAHLLHRITVGTEGGQLTLVNAHGPVVWTPRPHLPADADGAARYTDSAAPHLAYPSAEPVGPAIAPTYRGILERVWPDAVRRALSQLWAAAQYGEDCWIPGQRHLTLCQLMADLVRSAGRPQIVRHNGPPEVLSASLAGFADLTAAGGR